jgi:prepilin peptidase CpaA
MQLIAEFLVLIVFPALLLAAAGWDLASYTIPNAIQLALLATFFVFVLICGMTPASIGSHALAGVVGLACGFAFFALGYVGGGDAKLFACTALMLGFHDLLEYTLLAAVFGGALTLGLLVLRRHPLPQFLAVQHWILRLHDEQEGIPYGVALALGAFIILPHTEIFRIAAGV